MNDERMESIQQASDVNLMAMRMDDSIRPETDFFQEEQMKFNKFLIKNDENVPDYIQKEFWGFMDREMSLSNLDKEDVGRGMLWFDIAKINFMMNFPDYKLDFDTIRAIDQARFKSFVKMKRSTGGPDRERALIVSQFKELRIPEKQKVGGNILTRWFGGGQR